LEDFLSHEAGGVQHGGTARAAQVNFAREINEVCRLLGCATAEKSEKEEVGKRREGKGKERVGIVIV